jgi:hypothetical protein
VPGAKMAVSDLPDLGVGANFGQSTTPPDRICTLRSSFSAALRYALSRHLSCRDARAGQKRRLATRSNAHRSREGAGDGGSDDGAGDSLGGDGAEGGAEERHGGEESAGQQESGEGDKSCRGRRTSRDDGRCRASERAARASLRVCESATGARARCQYEPRCQSCPGGWLAGP